MNNKANKDIICSSDLCCYCIHNGKPKHCNPCYEYAGFQGRRLTIILESKASSYDGTITLINGCTDTIHRLETNHE